MGRHHLPELRLPVLLQSLLQVERLRQRRQQQHEPQMLLLLRLHRLLRRHGERLDPVLLRLQVQRHVHWLRLLELRKRRRHVYRLRLRLLELRKRRRNACRLRMRMQLRLPPLRKLIRSA